MYYARGVRKRTSARIAIVLLVLVAVVVVSGAVAGGAAAGTPRCCIPKTGGGGLPMTGLPLYLPVLASIGLIGTGLVLRRRAREDF
jgi:hypothetical protein